MDDLADKTPGLNGWDQYGKLVLHELSQLNTNILAMNVKISQMEKEIAALQAKSGVWGFVGGALVVLCSMGLGWLKGQ